MNARNLLAVVLLVGLAFASPAEAAALPCTVTLSGAVTATFECKVVAIPRGDRSMRITLSPVKLPKKQVKACIAGEFEVPPPAMPKAYSLHALVSGRAVITTANHKSYAASHDKGKAKETGELTLTLTSVEAAQPHQPLAVHGTVKARLAPTDGGKGAIDYEVAF